MEIPYGQPEAWLVSCYTPLFALHLAVSYLLDVGRWKPLDKSFALPVYLHTICFQVVSTGIWV